MRHIRHAGIAVSLAVLLFFCIGCTALMTDGQGSESKKPDTQESVYQTDDDTETEKQTEESKDDSQTIETNDTQTESGTGGEDPEFDNPGDGSFTPRY